jgi:RNA-splicing ligase RtcB
MITIDGKYSSAKVFTDNIDQETISQVYNILSQEFISGLNIRIMPDCHAGKGCVVGFTSNFKDKIVPNLIGVDIGCGMFVAELGKLKEIDLDNLDKLINKQVPSGFNTFSYPQARFDLEKLLCYKELKDINRIQCSIGTLGGGNHFIEVNIDDEGNYYLVIHSGSRNLGKQVADYYQNLAIKYHHGQGSDYNKVKKDLVSLYKKQGRTSELQTALAELDNSYSKENRNLPNDLCYLEGSMTLDYLHDMKLCQEYAKLNRKTMAEILLENLLYTSKTFHTVHNYIDDNYIRKGAVSAKKDEKLIIPINMRDGSLICIGKGNEDWNFSAPHGAGRIMSRRKAKEEITLEQFKDSMNGIFSTSVTNSTIDESPMAYKPMQEIIDNIGDTVDIVKIIKPVYNYKAK